MARKDKHIKIEELIPESSPIVESARRILAVDSRKQQSLLFCYLFPPNYEFYKDDVIQIWESAFLTEEKVFHTEEKVFQAEAESFFEEFEKENFFELSQFDPSTLRQMYKVNKSVVDLLDQNHSYFIRIDGMGSDIPELSRYASICHAVDPMFLEKFQTKELQTLSILQRQVFPFDQVCRRLFQNLPMLVCLDLSHTEITDLPSSISMLHYLRYLNLSYTPIITLPNSLCDISAMQTLNLRGCLNLLSLPKAIRKLRNLRHLDVDVDCLLVSMPPGLGDLCHLQTLPAFVVGRETGYQITELKNLLNLRGTLCIFMVGSISGSNEAAEAALKEKSNLETLELNWEADEAVFHQKSNLDTQGLQETMLEDAFQVLENLRPHRNIKELQIVGYHGAMFPDWIGSPLFSSLTTLTIHNSSKCEILPPLGRLPYLVSLHVSLINEAKMMNHRFCGRNTDTEMPNNAFPMLEKLTLNEMPKLEKWIEVEDGDFPRLQGLKISGCMKLETLPDLSLFLSLQQLEITLCPSLKSFTTKILSTSLESIAVIDCPILKDLCHIYIAENQGKQAHTTSIWMDNEQTILETSKKSVEKSGVIQEPLDFKALASLEDTGMVKLRYELLHDKATRMCFLFCSLYPGDSQIKTDVLLSYMLGEKLLEKVDTMEEARYRLCNIIDELISSGLLLRSEEGDIMMHAMIHDAAIHIASDPEEGEGFIVKSGLGLQEWPPIHREMEKCKRLSLMSNNLRFGLPHQVTASLLLTLSLSRNKRLNEIPRDFFEEMTHLKTLDLSETGIKSLPDSFNCLKSLRTFRVDECRNLVDISLVAELERLEILSVRHSKQVKLPVSMQKLANLKMLDVSLVRRPFPPKVISSLCRLEELYLGGYNFQGTWQELNSEVASLTCLTGLEICLPVECLLEDFPSNWKRLSKFSIRVGDVPTFNTYNQEISTTGFNTRMYLNLRSYVGDPMRISKWAGVLLDKVDYLVLSGCHYLSAFANRNSNCLYHSLRVLDVSDCDRMRHLLSTSGMTEAAEPPFRNLQVLRLYDLPDFVTICDGPSSPIFLNLRKLIIWSCVKLKSVLPMKAARDLLQLEELEIRLCSNVEMIFEDDGEYANKDKATLPLPRLRILNLFNLPSLSSFGPPGLLLDCPALVKMRVIECGNLKRLPFGKHSVPRIKELRVDPRWLDKLKWEDESVKLHLESLINPVDRQRWGIMTPMMEYKEEKKRMKSNEEASQFVESKEGDDEDTN